ncbi:MAG: transcriptional repressor LexA [Candidatus Levyibacteriota bacterium]
MFYYVGSLPYKIVYHKMNNLSNDPTLKQEEMLRFISSFIQKNNFSPTFREVAKAMEISVGTAQDQLQSLQKKGLLTWIMNKKRSIKLVDRESISPVIPTPLLGTISAGEGIAIHEEKEPEIINVPSHMITSGFGHYCLKVSGFSMSADGILDGDIIVVRQQASANDGDAVVAIIKDASDEKATLKRFYHHGNQIELRPRNQELRSKFYDPSQIEVRGKFRGLIRKD